MAFNFIELQKRRIYSQYKAKPKAIEWFLIFPFLGNQAAGVMETLQNTYDIDVNEGKQLDVIGHLLDQNRQFVVQSLQVMVPVAQFSYVEPDDFSSAAAQNAEYFGDEQAQFSPDSYPYVGYLSDIQYRQALKSRIQKNSTEATIDDIIEGVKLVLGENVTITLQDYMDMSFSISLDGDIAEETEFAITTDLIVNRPQGVKFRGYTLNAPQFMLIDENDTNAEQAAFFGDELAQCAGYIGAS